MDQQLTQRPAPLAFRVLISTSRGLNIILVLYRVNSRQRAKRNNFFMIHLKNGGNAAYMPHPRQAV